MSSTPVWVSAGSASAVSGAQTIAIAFAGGVLARTKLAGGRGSIKDITNIIVWFFGPCLTISRLTETLTLDTLLQLWLLPTFSVIIVLMGAVVGAVMCALMGVHARHAPVVISCCACGNALALPLSISQALSVNVDWIRDSDSGGGPALISYVFVYTVTDALILFGPVYFVLGWQPQRGGSLSDEGDGDEDDEGARLMEGVGESADPHSIYDAAPDKAGGKAEGSDSGSLSASNGSGGGGGGGSSSSTLAGQLASSCANPMLVASMVSVLLSLIEPLRSRFVQSALWQTMRTAGDATTPLMLANLGAGMALHMKQSTAPPLPRQPQQQQLPRRLVIAVVLGRLVVCPVATVAILAAAVRAGMIPGSERLLLLFLLMQGATPSAMFLGVMTQMHGDAEREAIMSQLLFVLNIAAIPLFTAAVEKTASFFALALCLTRAYLGKTIVFIYKWRENAVFRRCGCS